MNKKNFVPPIIEQWIEKINDPNTNDFNRENYVGYLEYTREAINQALVKYNKKRKNND